MNVALRLLMRKPAPASYSALILASNPEIYWRLGNAVGVAAVDSSTNNRPSTAQSPSGRTSVAGLVSGDADTAQTFFVSAASGYYQRSYEAWQDDTTFTAEAIIKPTSVTGGSNRSFISFDGSTHRFWWVYLDPSTSTLKVNVGTTTIVSCATTLVSATAYHVAVVSNGTNVRVFLNGTVDGTSAGALSAPGGSTGRRFEVGTTGNGSGTGVHQLPFVGVIDEVVYFSSALSDATIDAHATAAGY